MKKITIFFLGLLLAGSLNAKSFGEIYTDCGLGGLIGGSLQNRSNVEARSIVADIIAIYTNITWDLGSTASSSATTSPDTCANSRTKVALFMLKGYDQLEGDIARGEGEYLDGLLEIGEVSMDSLRGATRDIVALEGYASLSGYEKAERLFNSLYQ